MPLMRYDLIINGNRAEKVKPRHGEYVLLVEDLKEFTKYSIVVVGIPKGKLRSSPLIFVNKCYLKYVCSKDDVEPLISNEIIATLPLDLSGITLPEQKQRILDSNYYNEYIEYIPYEEPRKSNENKYALMYFILQFLHIKEFYLSSFRSAAT